MKRLIICALTLMTMVSCSAAKLSEVGKRSSALEDSAWEASSWISAKDAPVLKGTVVDGTRSAAGLIKSSWKYDGDAWNRSFTIPEGAHATVILPGEKEPKEYTSGSYNITKNL